MKKTLSKIIIFILIAILLIITIIKIIFETPDSTKEFKLNYDNIGKIQEDFIVVSKKNKFGYYNIKTNKLLTKVKYELTDSMKDDEVALLDDLIFNDGLAPITDNNLIGLINTEGETIIKPKYETLTVFNKNLILVFKDSYYYFIDSNENKVFEDKFKIVQNINNQTFIVTNGEKHGIIDDKGNYLLELLYDEINLANDDKNYVVLKATINNKKERYLLKDKKLIHIGNEEIISIIQQDNLVYYKENNNNIIYNMDTNIKTNIIGNYIMIIPSNTGVYLAMDQNERVGYIDYEGNVISQFIYKYDKSQPYTKFNNAIIQKQQLLGVIDKEGRQVLPMEYHEIEILAKDKFLVMDQDEKINIIDDTKKSMTNNAYNNISLTNNPNYLVSEIKKGNDNLYGVIDIDGNIIVDPIYKKITIYEDYIKIEKGNGKYIIKKCIVKNGTK